jgi:hypothetical protein
MAHPGQVFRRGDSVVRPAPPSWEALHAFLLDLRSGGFEGAPVPTGPVVDGREQLEFMPGDVPHTPFPAWADDEPVLTSVGALLRRFHVAANAIAFDTAAPWSTELADPEGGPLLCHNDVCHENVAFADGRALSIFDFDFAAPGRPEWDLAMTAWYWVPMRPAAFDRGLDPFRRMRILADSYGLPADDRPGFMDVMVQAVGVCRTFVAARVAAGERPFVDRLEHLGGWPHWDHIQSWLDDNRTRFTEALTR